MTRCSGRPCLFALLLLVACERRGAEKAEDATLPEGVVASVSSEAIAAATVARIAGAQGIDPHAACERAISDALFAAAARQKLGSAGTLETVENAAHARVLLEELSGQARAKGPPSDAEVAELTRERWAELDRPSLARTIHAVALAKQPSDKAAARAVAARIAEAVRGAASSDEFKRRAEAVPRAGIDVRVERLAPTTADGRVFDPGNPAASGQSFDETFAHAATSIPEVGGTSPIVETRFGYHVIRLEERLPEKRVALEERRRLLFEEIVARRAALEQRHILEAAGKAQRVEIDRMALDLTAKLRVAE
jgi:peptidyl-prolyl cis-trans isomerase C